MIYLKRFTLSIISLISISSCTAYNNLLDFLYVNDGLAEYIVNYVDDDGQPASDHVIDFDILDKETLKVYVYSSNPDEFDSYIIKAPYEILTTF